MKEKTTLKTEQQLQTKNLLSDMLGRLEPTVHILARNRETVIIQVTKSSVFARKKIHKPVQVEVPIPQTNRESALYAWIIGSLCQRRLLRLLPFAFENQTILKMADELYRKTSKSHGTLGEYIYQIYRFCHWLNDKTPDQIISACRLPDGMPDTKTLYYYGQQLDDWAADLAAEGKASNTVASYLKGPKALFERNKLELQYPIRTPQKVMYKDKAPTPEELQRLLNIATIRDKVIVTFQALGAFREGTLSKLKYYHVKEDLERNVIPIHIHVEAEITKGKYHDYDTFVGREAVEYLRAYLDERRRGSPRQRTPPEEIHDDSPLLRAENTAKIIPLAPTGIYFAVKRLYERAGLTKRRGPRYELRDHSLRKYFRTQMTALGVNSDYIEYMMGHKVSTYHDIQMKGIEFLRNIYTAADLSIRPKTHTSKLEQLKELCRVLGYNPEKVLIKEALMEPHRAYLRPANTEEHEIQTLRKTVKELLRKELLDTVKSSSDTEKLNSKLFPLCGSQQPKSTLS